MIQCNGLTDCVYRVLTHANVVGNIESIVKIAAVLIAAWWTYSLFIRQRQSYPRAAVAHTVRHTLLGSSKRLVQVAIEVRNIGNTLMRVRKYDVRLQYLGPFRDEHVEKLITEYPPMKTDAEPAVRWRLLAQRLAGHAKTELPSKQDFEVELEPGESDALNFDFIINDEVDVIRVYSYLQNHTKRWRFRRKWWRRIEIGWTNATIHELRDSAAMARRIAQSFRNGNQRRIRRNSRTMEVAMPTEAAPAIAVASGDTDAGVVVRELPGWGRDEQMQRAPEPIPEPYEPDSKNESEEDSGKKKEEGEEGK
ncbi:MAG TPA: hypothetical protein VFZ04_15230 [Longimicrobiales bacterium]